MPHRSESKNLMMENTEESIKSMAFQSMALPPLNRGVPAGRSGVNTPLRCLRLFVFAFLLPCILIAIPLYQRKVTYAPRVYTLTTADMRSLQDGVSTVWCEAQEVSSVVPFTSYRADAPLPQRRQRVPVTVRHRLRLVDDIKEYWGFYLLRGSRIAVSACARWPGTSMLLVQGWNALRDCVWVGQIDSLAEESSEEGENDEDPADDGGNPIRRRWREFLKKERINSQGVIEDGIQRIDDLKALLGEGSRVEAEPAGRARSRRSGQGRQVRRSVGPTPRPVQIRLTNDIINDDLNKVPNVDHRESAETDPLAVNHTLTHGRFVQLTANGHRGRVNQSLGNDTSADEMMSSFSSSEEALLNCPGVILNLPLEALKTCAAQSQSSAAGAVRVQVIRDDYYYLVFSSENELLPVDVFYDVSLEKTLYDTSAASRVCENATACRVELAFAADQRVVVEFPAAQNASEAVWSEHYSVRASCVSRAWLTAVFVVAAVLSLFVCAFC